MGIEARCSSEIRVEMYLDFTDENPLDPMPNISFGVEAPRMDLLRAKTSQAGARWKKEAKERVKMRQQKKINAENTALANRLQVPRAIEPSKLGCHINIASFLGRHLKLRGRAKKQVRLRPRTEPQRAGGPPRRQSPCASNKPTQAAKGLLPRES